MIVKGKFIKELETKSGTSAKGEWSKKDIILELENNRKLCVTLWNELTKLNFKDGEELQVHINLESREFNDKYYTDVKAWKIDKSEVKSVNNVTADLPF